MNELYRVRRAIFNQPWAIMPDKLEAIAEIIERRVAGEDVQLTAGPRRRTVRSGRIAVLPLFGTISHRMNMLAALSGGTSSEQFGQIFQSFVNDPDIGEIIIDIDSPGGAVAGTPELAQRIFEARQSGTQITAVANSLAASSAFWIGAAAHQFLVTPSGKVGSIGIIAMHQDVSKRMAELGVKNTLITAGKFKVESNPFEPLGDVAEAEIQRHVDEAHNQMVADIARFRGVGEKTVREKFGQGRVVSAAASVKLGMTDGVATLEQAIAKRGGGNQRRPARSVTAESVRAQMETGDIPSARAFEAFLCDAGMSIGSAKCLMSNGYEAYKSRAVAEQDADLCDADPTALEIIEILKSAARGAGAITGDSHA